MIDLSGRIEGSAAFTSDTQLAYHHTGKLLLDNRTEKLRMEISVLRQRNTRILTNRWNHIKAQVLN
jgi:hypothetical protein